MGESSVPALCQPEVAPQGGVAQSQADERAPYDIHREMLAQVDARIADDEGADDHQGGEPLAADRSITLKTEREAAASAWVNQQWKFFSTYYTGLGISKQTLMKVRENEARRELLLEAYYGANGLQPVIYMTSITDDAAEIEAEAHPLKLEK